MEEIKQEEVIEEQKQEVLDEDDLKEQEARAAEESALNKNVTVKFLLKFTIPTILSFFVMNVFFVVDGVFASRGVSVIALSAINVTTPFFTFAAAIAAMLAMGGCALVAKKKGMKLKQEARENFTLITIITFVTSMIISVLGLILIEPILRMLGTDDFIHDSAREYLRVIILFIPFIMLGYFLVQYVIADGRPMLGMMISFTGTIISTILNALFIFVFDLGVTGLALATGIGFGFISVVCVFYFLFYRKGTLYFVRPKWNIRALGRASLNGISEAITMMAVTVTTIVMNNVLVRIVGFEGIAAAGIVLVLQGVFMSLYFGYSAGVAPLVSYNYGKQLSSDDPKYADRLKKFFKKSLIIISVISVISIIAIQAFAPLLVQIYVPREDEVYGMALRGLRIASTGFLLMGFNIFATALFTAFNDGKISGFLSLMRTLVFMLTLMILLPMAFGLTGAWIAMPLAEALSIVLTIIFLVLMGKKYKYLDVKKSTVLESNRQENLKDS
ncbi:MAG: MATE family efflux transporter [Firmicutes bacterium]|nr:MATE family efflux transporter [Bacillota bacterium]